MIIYNFADNEGSSEDGEPGDTLPRLFGGYHTKEFEFKKLDF